MVTFNINLDLKQSNYSRMSCKQNDDIALELAIFNGNVAQDLTDSTVTLNALRSNNTFVKQTSGITIKDNIITVECMRDITRVSGSVNVELVITKLNKQKTTFNIDLDVVPSVITNNAEASKNVVGVIEELDNKIYQGTEIITEVNRNKNEAIGTVNKLKEDTIARVTELKEGTITQLNTTKKEVEELKNTTVKESSKIKEDTINELNNIKADGITELTKIKQESITELNNINDTVNEDLTKIKMDTTKEVNEAVDRAIEEITKYNIKEINDKVDGHIDNIDLHVTNEFKEDVYRLKEELTDKLVPIKTSNTLTKLENSQNGYLSDVVIKGKTLVNLLPNTNKWSTTQRDGTTIDISNNKISWKVAKELKDHSMVYAYVPNIKTSTTYTLIADIEKNTLDKDFVLLDGYSEINIPTNHITLAKGETGKKVVTITTKSVLKDPRVCSYVYKGTTTGELVISNIMLLEGDYTKNPPDYFEGIKSAGEVNYLDGKYVGKNLFNLKDYSLSYAQNLATVSYLNNGYRAINKGIAVNGFVSIQEIKLKPNTNYRLSVDILNKGTQEDGALGRVRIYDPQSNESIGYTQGGTPNSKIRRSAGFNSRETGVVAIGFYHSPNDTNTPAPIGELFEWTDIQIEEGIVETDYEPYYEGSRIEILSTSKNLISLKELKKNNSYNSNAENFFTNDSLVIESISELRWGYCGFKLPKLKPNTVYTIQRKYNSDMNVDAAGRIRVYKNGNVDISVAQTSDMKPITFNSGNDNENLYILFYAKSSNEKLNKVTFYDIQLEEGTVATEYEPYKSHKTEILLKEPLREWDKILGNGIVERNSEQLFLSGSETYILLDTKSGGNTNLFELKNITGNKSNIADTGEYPIICDRLPVIYAGTSWNNDIECCSINHNGTIHLRILKSKAKDVTEFKAWLSKEKPVMILQTETSVIEANNRILNRWDIIKENGTIETYGKQVLLNGTEDWEVNKLINSVTRFSLKIDNTKKDNSSSIIATKNNILQDITAKESNNEIIGVALHLGGTLTMNLNNRTLGITDADTDDTRISKLKVWLAKEKPTITYESESLTIENVINKPLTIRSFKDGYIQQDITIPAVIEGKYPISLGGSIQSNINALDKIEKELGGTWRVLLNLADKELQMLAIEPLVDTDDISNKVNEILNVWR